MENEKRNKLALENQFRVAEEMERQMKTTSSTSHGYDYENDASTTNPIERAMAKLSCEDKASESDREVQNQVPYNMENQTQGQKNNRNPKWEHHNPRGRGVSRDFGSARPDLGFSRPSSGSLRPDSESTRHDFGPTGPDSLPTVQDFGSGQGIQGSPSERGGPIRRGKGRGRTRNMGRGRGRGRGNNNKPLLKDPWEFQGPRGHPNHPYSSSNRSYQGEENYQNYFHSEAEHFYERPEWAHEDLKHCHSPHEGGGGKYQYDKSKYHYQHVDPGNFSDNRGYSSAEQVLPRLGSCSSLYNQGLTHPQWTENEQYSYGKPFPQYNREEQNYPYQSTGSKNFPVDKYSESDRSSQSLIIEPVKLVNLLCKQENFKLKLLYLFEKYNLKPDSVRLVATANSNVFQLDSDVVELCPKVAICSDYTSSLGCLSLKSCQNLHICPLHVANRCTDQNCIFGHKWDTDHNSSVLRPLHIGHLSKINLAKLIQVVHAGVESSTLDICDGYNGSGCHQLYCNDLHICLNYITGGGRCSLKNCGRNHNLHDKDCSKLLILNKIALNEAPRDVIAAIIKANPVLSQGTKILKQKNPGTGNKFTKSSDQINDLHDQDAANEPSDDDHLTSIHNKSGKNMFSKVNSDFNNQMRDETHSSQPTDKDASGNPLEAKPIIKTVLKKETVWFDYLHGETLVPQICYYSVESSCKYEKDGCRLLHGAFHFHWQVRENFKDSNWFNLRSPQVVSLERAYCDPDQNKIALPRLDPSSLEKNARSLLTLMGRDIWMVDFHNMEISNSDNSKTLIIRRLATEDIKDIDIPSNNYAWYFKDINQKWVKYGKVDTAGKTNLVSSMTSDDIEKDYAKNPKNTKVTFKNAEFNYNLDFTRMTQINLHTQVVRAICRRPLPHLKDESSKEDTKKNTTSSSLPSTWEPMLPQERSRLVNINSVSNEYQQVLGLFNATMAKNVTKIERIQNPFLWQAFENKIKEMTILYGDITKVNVRQLFHGTKPDIVPKICNENFDWRLHGSAAGQSYGRGTYFAPEASTSNGYTSPDSQNMRKMFVAQVAVGSLINGNSAMVRPPINPATDQPYDSTGNNGASSSIIVKYDKQEYYPEYIITYM